MSEPDVADIAEARLKAELRDSVRALVEHKRAALSELVHAFDAALAAGPRDHAAWDRASELAEDGDVKVAVAHAFCLLRKERRR